MATTQLDPSAGFYLRGVTVDTTTFLATVQFRQLRAVTRDPMSLQLSTAPRRDEDPELEAEREVHDLVQRAVSGKKKTNVVGYAEYIGGILKGKVGVLPPIHLWSKGALNVYEVEAGTFILVPLGDTLLAIDGETQLTAHWRLVRQLTDTALKDQHNAMPLSVVLHHGVNTDVARQYFHDLNILAVRPNIGVGLAMDNADPIMQIVGDIEATDPLAGKVERQARQLAKRSDKLVTLPALRQMVINMLHGMAGVQYGSRPAPVDDDQLVALKILAPKVVRGYFTRFGSLIADREHFIAGTAPVLAAVGAMAAPLLTMPESKQAATLEAVLAGLDQVDWTRGAPWGGIAGDYTSRGVFSVKGTKEVSYAVYNALNDQRSPAYHQVRQPGLMILPSGHDPQDILAGRTTGSTT